MKKAHEQLKQISKALITMAQFAAENGMLENAPAEVADPHPKDIPIYQNGDVSSEPTFFFKTMEISEYKKEQKKSWKNYQKQKKKKEQK